jgi:hypothetical protein
MGKNKGQWQDHRNFAGIPNQPDQPDQPENAIGDVSEATDSDPSQTANPLSTPPESGDLAANQAYLGANASSVHPPAPDSTNLSDFVSKLSPEQLAKIRTLAASAGLSTGPQKGPNGGLLVLIEVPQEAIDPLQTWAQESGSSFAEFVSKVAGDAIVNYCFGDWSAVREAPAPAPVAVTAVAP